MGATAIGTGIDAPHGYAEMVHPLLAAVSGIPVVKAENLVEATQDTAPSCSSRGAQARRLKTRSDLQRPSPAVQRPAAPASARSGCRRAGRFIDDCRAR